MCILTEMRLWWTQTMPYRLDESTGLIDYDTLEKTAALYRPKVPPPPRTKSDLSRQANRGPMHAASRLHRFICNDRSCNVMTNI